MPPLPSDPVWSTLRAEMQETLAEVTNIIEIRKRMFRPTVGAPTIQAAVDHTGRPMLSELLTTRANLLIALAGIAREEDTPT